MLKEKAISKQIFDIGDCTIQLHDVDREIWKNIAKATLIQYYHSISKYILPFIQERPQSLHVKPFNANAPVFYIKDMEGHEPACAQIFTDKRKHKRAGKRNEIDYLVCNNEATLLYLINLGCIDINPWNSKTNSPNEPDYIVIDLDPSDNDFNKVIETTLAAKEYFASRKLIAFAKTSGKTGMHLLLPCSGMSYPVARSLAEGICGGIHEMVPTVTTTEVSIALRGKKLFIDPSQNDYADTIASAFSARPFHTPTISMPLRWTDIKTGLNPQSYTIRTSSGHIANAAAIFSKVFDKKVIAKNNKSLKVL